MSFSQSGGSFSGPQYSQAPDFQPYQYAPLNPMPEERPGLMSLLAQSLGSGLGEGVAGGIKQQLKRSALEKMLANVNPNMSPKERLLTVAGADESTQPVLQDYFKQIDKQNESQAFNQGLQNIYGAPQQGQNPQEQSQQRQQPTAEGQPGQGIGVPQGVSDPNYQKILINAAQHKSDQDQKERHKNEEKSFKQKERQIEFEQKRVLPILEEVDAARRTIDARRTSLNLQKQAVQTGDVAGFKNYLSELTGAENLRSTEGAIFKTAGKELFLNSLSKINGRPNQWIEQQLSDAQAKIGRSTEANLSTIAVQEYSLDLLDKETKLYQDLAEQYINDPNFGYVPSNINRLVNQAMKPYTLKKEKELAPFFFLINFVFYVSNFISCFNR